MTSTRTDRCAGCGLNLEPVHEPENRPPCPNCGSRSQVSVVINETLQISEQIVVSKTRQYYEKNRKITAILVGVWLGSSIIGYIIGGGIGLAVGIVLGGLSFVLPASITRVRETETFGN